MDLFRSMTSEDAAAGRVENAATTSSTFFTGVVEEGQVVLHPNSATTAFKVGKRLGRGGSSTCHLFTNIATQQVFAAKLIPLHQYPFKRVENEAALHLALRHTNVVRMVDWFILPGAAFAVLLLEYCEAASLKEYLAKRNCALAVGEVQYFARQTLSALRYLHQDCEVIHRDVKLGNLLLTSDLQLKIGDFGMATKLKRDGEAKEEEVFFGGTASYMAPEVIRQATAGHSFPVDVWAFGVVLYVLLVGRAPFDDVTVRDTFARIQCAKFTLPDTVPAPFQDLIRRIFQLTPALRPTLLEIATHACLSWPNPPLSLPALLLCGSAPAFVLERCSTERDKQARMAFLNSKLDRHSDGNRSLLPRSLHAPPPRNEIVACCHADFGLGVLFASGLVSIVFREDESRICWPLDGPCFLYGVGEDAVRHSVRDYAQFPAALRRKMDQHRAMQAKFLPLLPLSAALVHLRSNSTLEIDDDYLVQAEVRANGVRLYLSKQRWACAKFKDGTQVSRPVSGPVSSTTTMANKERILAEWLSIIL